MRAEIIAIGTELLLGNTLDTNTHYLANLLRQLGVDLFRTSIVGDNADRIAQAVRESLGRAELVITSGGLGPTIDDATREGVAKAIDRPLEFQPELWAQIQDRFKRYGRRPTENNRRQAYIPQGAAPLENLSGTAPAFFVEIEGRLVISLPGVPGELTALADQELGPIIRSRLSDQHVILVRNVRTSGIGESWLDQVIQDLEYGHNPTVGLSAQPGRVDIRITAKAEQEKQAIKMLDQVQAELEQRLGDHIYGIDQETLESVIVSLLDTRGLKLVFWVDGFDVHLSELEESDLIAVKSISFTDIRELPTELDQMKAPDHTTIYLALTLEFGVEGSRFQFGLRLDDDWTIKHRSYGGAPEYAHEYALSHALDSLRRYLLDN